jgi:type I restriction enzyme R subunit
MDENVIAHAFHHNAFLIVSNGDSARYGSITSAWEHFGEWKRWTRRTRAAWRRGVAQRHAGQGPLLDIVENFILFDASKPGRAQGGGAQPSGAGREPGGGGGGAARG